MKTMDTNFNKFSQSYGYNIYRLFFDCLFYQILRELIVLSDKQVGKNFQRDTCRYADVSFLNDWNTHQRRTHLYFMILE